jgi:hypothetical protein
LPRSPGIGIDVTTSQISLVPPAPAAPLDRASQRLALIEAELAAARAVLAAAIDWLATSAEWRGPVHWPSCMPAAKMRQ